MNGIFTAAGPEIQFAQFTAATAGVRCPPSGLQSRQPAATRSQAMPDDIVLTILKELRADAKDFCAGTRRNFGVALQRPSVLEAT